MAMKRNFAIEHILVSWNSAYSGARPENPNAVLWSVPWNRHTDFRFSVCLLFPRATFLNHSWRHYSWCDVPNGGLVVHILFVLFLGTIVNNLVLCRHYENMPFQNKRKFHLQNLKIFR